MNEIKPLSIQDSYYQDFYENAPVAYFLISLDGSIKRCNKTATRLLGHSRQELIRMNIFDLYANTPEGLPKARKLFRDFLEGKPIEDEELQMIHKSGKHIWISLSVSAIHDEMGKIIESRSIVMDITKRKSYEQDFFKESKKVESYLELAGVIVLALNKEGNITLLNKKGYEILEYQKGELEECNWFEKCIHPRLRGELSKVFNQLMRGELEPVEFFTNPIITKSGKEKIIAWHNSILYDEAGNPVGALSSGENITEKIQKEREIKISEEKFRTIFEETPRMNALVDLDGIILDTNHNFINFFGIDKQDIIGRNWMDIFLNKEIFPDPHDKNLINIFRSLQKGIIPEPIELKQILNGKEAWTLFRTALIDLEGKSLILASGDDITRSKVTEKKIKESEEKYRLLFENMVEGFAYHKIITDKNGTPINYTFVDVNPAFETFSGLKRDDLIGKKVTEVFPRIENDPVDWIGKFGKVALTGNPLHFEEYFEAYNRWYGISAYSPKKGFFVIVFIDITDRKQAEQKLKASEEKYRKLFESSPIGIGISDMDGNVHEINKVMEKITAFTLEDFQKMKIKSTYVNLEDRIEVMKILKENGEVRDFEVKLKRKGGSAYDALMNITKIKIENKELFLTNIRDITDFKKANIELKESEKKYRSLFENTTEGLALYEVISDEMEKPLDFTCLEVNSVFEEITGSKSRDIVGKKITELLPGIRNDLSNWFEKIGNDALGGKSLHIEYFSRNYNLWLSISAYSPMKRFVVVIMRDITKRKKAEQDLKESEEKFRTIFEQANDSILLLDENLIILDCNRKTSEKFGFNNAMELIGKTLIDLSPEMQPGGTRSEKQLSEFFKQVFMDKLHNFYWLQKRKDGSCFDSEVSTNVLSIEGNIRVQMIVHDITEHIEAERLIREENKKLVQLQKTRNNLINRISHELKTPLISIKGFSDYLLQIHSVGLNDEIKSSLEDIKAGVKRMETVIEKFLETNYLESPHFKLVREKSDLHDLIHLCISSLRGYARLRNLEIFQNLTGKLKINIDKKKITEVLTNILINAIKFTPPDGKIFLTTSTQNGSVLVSIRDTGIGFTNKELGQIFAQFGKIERFGKGWDIVTEGSGLGLYISKLIINAHGGKIWVESEGRNKGSTFYFTIPLKNT